MIVICTKCQAKFRVADEKIGPRGAKVRCSKCQTIFAVHPDLGTMPLGPERASPAQRPPAAAAATPPTRGAPRPRPAPVPDAPAVEPPAAWSAPPVDDPFAAFAAPAAPSPAPADDPFAAPASPPHATLPVTDLSDLLGLPTQSASPAVASPPPPEPAAPSLDAGMFDGVRAFDPASIDLAAPAADVPERAAPPELPAMPGSGDGELALEERLTPPQFRAPAQAAIALPDDAFDGALGTPRDPGADPFAVAARGEPFDPSSFELQGGTPSELFGGAPELAGTADAAEPVPAPPPQVPPPLPAATPGPVPVRGLPAAEPGPAPGGAPAAVAAAPAAAPQQRAAVPGRSRLRALVVNAVALVALVVVALGFLVVWRTGGALDAASLRPAAILDALRRDPARNAPFLARGVRSGLYERERAPPLLFVRGSAVSRAPAAVRALEVTVEVVRAGQVVARGEALAGAVATPEELFLAGDAAALAAVSARARSRAPARVKPGDAVPFLVAIGGAPADLDGASLRVEVAPAGGGAR